MSFKMLLSASQKFRQVKKKKKKKLFNSVFAAESLC